MNDESVQPGLSLAKSESQPLARRAEEPSIGEIIQAVVQKGVTSENVGAVEKLVALYERLEDKKAQREFAAAFKALQSEMKGVKAMSPVPGNDGGVRYKFAAYEDIMEQVKPVLEKHGFTVSFSTEFAEGRLIKICCLQHVGGHTKETRFAVLIGKGPPNASPAQADGAASTYAKRFALCDALNIVIEKDSDARLEGAPISKKDADSIQVRLRNTGGDEKAFLKFAGAESFEEISSVKLEMLEEFLSKKERIYMQKMGAK